MEKELKKLKEQKEVRTEEVRTECPDGIKRTRREYINWIDDLVMNYN